MSNPFAKELSGRSAARRGDRQNKEQRLSPAYTAATRQYRPAYIQVLRQIEAGLRQEMLQDPDMKRIFEARNEKDREYIAKHGNSYGGVHIATVPGESPKVVGCQVRLVAHLDARYIDGVVVLGDRVSSAKLEDDDSLDSDGYFVRHDVIVNGWPQPQLRELEFDPQCYKSEQALPLLIAAEQSCVAAISTKFQNGELVEHVLRAFDISQYAFLGLH